MNENDKEAVEMHHQEILLLEEDEDNELMELYEQYRRILLADAHLRAEALAIQHEVNTLMTLLDSRDRNVNIARLTGSSVSIIGSAIGIAGGILSLTGALAPVGVPMMLAGFGVGVAGATTNIGSRVTKHFLDRSNLSDLQRRIAEFQETLSQKEEELDGVGNTNTENVGDGLMAAAGFAGKIGIAGVSAAQAGRMAAGVAARTAATTAGRVAVVGGAIMIPLDIVEIVRVSLNIHRGTAHPARQQLTRFAEALETICRD